MLSAVRPLGLTLKSYTTLLMMVSTAAFYTGGAVNYYAVKKNIVSDPYIKSASEADPKQDSSEEQNPIISLPGPNKPLQVVPETNRSLPQIRELPGSKISVQRETPWEFGKQEASSQCWNLSRRIILEYSGNVTLVYSRSEHRTKGFPPKTQTKSFCLFEIEQNK